MDELASDPDVKSAVIICEGRTFFAGADITEFGKPFIDPLLIPVIDKIEASEKPVVAAIHGTALGGGCEVALGCNYRIAVPSAQLGLPEIQLGLLPGAGGTQRLPRVVGVEAALEMVALGQPVTAAQAKKMGLIDRLAEEGRLLGEAIAMASELADARPLPRASEKSVDADPAIFDSFEKANARKFKGFDAPGANIRCIEAAIALPFAEGMKVEAEEFKKLFSGSQAAAQQYMFFAQRRAAKIDDIPRETKPREVRSVGVVGAGTMGVGIAMNFLSAGIPVTLVEVNEGALGRGVGVMRKNYNASAARGRITPEAVEHAMGLLMPTVQMDDLSDCDLIIEAVFEQMEIKKQIFATLDTIAKPDAILATNTSYLNVDEIAAVTSRPGDVVGMHFFSPANVMKLLEVVRGEKTADDVLATVMGIAKTIKKVAVVAGVCFGFIGNRMLRQRQGALILEQGIAQRASDIDVIWVFGYGWPAYRGGPMFWTDMVSAKTIVEGIEAYRDKLDPEFHIARTLKEKADNGGSFIT
ncbi:hypothetical protein CAF53_12930 [Sphingobium sp. LB126]|uniref:3-hydroxyacyl-CoA dehydrogenase NAD-binding domain-containing protein n=1 Tax=Sphingobium sp. LB126 TaxID=1983755 RepID=UPI000C208E94|nr:3-hydroxyacyl-CoA dehydrogenase NAD-binding domain-containing protein [Sphingobium sp. LB126]PJG49032.1 hypothetical protein CAF53_12930 [Sphingobium sp. LB126]